MKYQLTPVILATQEAETRNSSQDPVSKNPSQKGLAQGIGPEFKPQYWEKRKKIKYWPGTGGSHL
jgi:hypothetical protein